MTLVALVLAGGTGTRLYPAARPDRPKQFLAFGDDDRSLFARTVDRVDFADATVAVTGPSLADRVRERFDGEVVVDPAPRDTGPALVHATHRCRERFDDPTLLVCPSDHHVGDDAAFREAAETGARVASDTDRLVTFGVEPTRPETEYGYVEPGADRGAYREVASFHEKPDARTAREYLDRGYLWNAGLFAWRASAFLAAARDSPLAPVVEACEAGAPERGFETVAPVSVDRAVLERSPVDRAVVPVAFPWDDLGTWDAVGRHAPREADNDALAPLTAVDATDNVVASDGTHVSLVGVSDLVVAAYDDRVLVVPRDRAGDVRDLVDRLRAEGRWA